MVDMSDKMKENFEEIKARIDEHKDDFEDIKKSVGDLTDKLKDVKEGWETSRAEKGDKKSPSTKRPTRPTDPPNRPRMRPSRGVHAGRIDTGVRTKPLAAHRQGASLYAGPARMFPTGQSPPGAPFVRGYSGGDRKRVRHAPAPLSRLEPSWQSNRTFQTPTHTKALAR